MFGDDDLQHGVAEELEPLVRLALPVFVRVAAVREGQLKELGVYLDAQLLQSND